MTLNNSKLYNGTEVSDLFSYQVEQTEGYAWEIILIGFYIVVAGIMLKRQFEPALVFFATSTLTLLFAVIIYMGGWYFNIALLSEQGLIATVLVWVVTMMNFKYNKVEND